MANLLILQGVVASIAFLLYQIFLRKNKKNLPPGPKGLPLLGNLFDLPPPNSPNHLHWLKHKDLYGPISSITLLGKPVIILHGHQEVQEILEKASVKTSGRPVLEFANYCGMDRVMAYRQFDDAYKHQRRLFSQAIGTKTIVAKYADIQEVEARRLMIRMLRDPQSFVHNFSAATAAIILKLVYGYTIEPHKPDPLVQAIDQMMLYFSRCSIPFNRLIDFIPAVKYLPENFPGMGFKRIAREANKLIQTVANVPFDFARQQMATHNRTDSYVARLIGNSEEEKTKNTHDLDMIKWSAAILYGGASETSVPVLMGFILAMIRFPSVQCKARVEIDAVTGGTRLPNLQDRDKMPYIKALVSEALRWFVILPLGFLHKASEDISYTGYDIPKGAIIIASAWWLMHDPEVYANPHVFEPERFLASRNEPDPRNVVFGFGRRICPGRHLADAGLFLYIAHFLAIFNISKAIDAQGREIEPGMDIEPNIVTRLKEFPFKIEPRSEKHKELILEFERQHGWDESDSSQLGELPPIVDVEF